MITLTVTSRTKNTAILNWANTATGITNYEIWRRHSANSDGVATGKIFTKIADVSDTSYQDEVMIDIDKPTVPEIIKNTQTKRSEILINLKTKDIGSQFEYYVVGDSVMSNTVTSETMSGIKGFNYLVKRLIDDKTVPLFEATEKFIFSESDAINITELVDGQYIFYAKSIDNDKNESDISNVLFYVRNQYLDIEKNINQIPTGVRYNNRYRGPHESKKVGFMYMQLKNNINILKGRMKALDILKDSIIVKPNYSNTNILESIEVIEVKLADIREELQYEKRND